MRGFLPSHKNLTYRTGYIPVKTHYNRNITMNNYINTDFTFTKKQLEDVVEYHKMEMIGEWAIGAAMSILGDRYDINCPMSMAIEEACGYAARIEIEKLGIKSTKTVRALV